MDIRAMSRVVKYGASWMLNGEMRPCADKLLKKIRWNEKLRMSSFEDFFSTPNDTMKMWGKGKQYRVDFLVKYKRCIDSQCVKFPSLPHILMPIQK